MTCENRPSGSHIHFNYNSAAQSYKLALDIKIQLSGREHQTTVDSHSELGATQYALGDYTSAAKSHGRALNIGQKGLGEEDENTADSYLNLGLTQYMLRDTPQPLSHSNEH